MTRILGINRTQDASISLFDNGQHVFSIHKERLTKTKHHWGKLGDIQLYAKYYPDLLEKPIEAIVECFSCDKELTHTDLYLNELIELLEVDESRIFQISHHLAHAYSAFFPSGFSDAAIIILDFVGSEICNLTENHSLNFASNEFEVGSVYFGSDDGIELISKQTWDGNRLRPSGLGQFFFFLTQCLFIGEGNEGKVMGLSAYGNPNKLDLPKLDVIDGEILIPEEWAKLFQDRDTYSFNSTNSTFQEKADLAAIGQATFETALLELSEWVLQNTGATRLCYAGGCALNCVANSRLTELIPIEHIFIPPAPHDGGTSLGCAMYGNEIKGIKTQLSWHTDYLGKPPAPVSPLEFGLGDFIEYSKPEDLPRVCASLIESGEVLSIFQGASEFGPRALGHRSLLGNAKFEITKQYINSVIKNREWFRPIAPIVLEEDAPRIFDFTGSSPYMLFTANIRPEYYSKFKAIEHIDFSARLQTINKGQDAFIYELLQEYKKLSGYGLISNTSLNGENQPIVEVLSEAISFLLNHKINYLVAPPYLITKKNKTRKITNFKSFKKLAFE